MQFEPTPRGFSDSFFQHLIKNFQLPDPLTDERMDWRKSGSYVQKAGRSVWLPNIYLTKNEIHRVSVLIYWAAGKKEP